MPRKFFNFRRGNAPKGHTKPITRQYFSGPSHFVDAQGKTITPATHPQYVNSNTGQLDLWHLRNAQKRGKVNEFPNQAGSSIAVSFEQAL